MLSIRINLKNKTRQKLQKMISKAEKNGDLRQVIRIMAILALANGQFFSDIAITLNVSQQSVIRWFNAFLLHGIDALKSKKIPGRKPSLTKTQKRELDKMIAAGPEAAGFPGACWRSPMIQKLIYDKFGVFYAAHYISQLLKNMGFSYQKAKFVSDHIDTEKRKEWLEKSWPEIISEARKKNSRVLFGDEASFPQWGSLSYTWAKRGQTPVVKTSGIRKGYKVLGLIDYFTGQFFYKCQEQRLNSESYASFLNEVIKKTRKNIILIQDGARYHTSKAMKEFFQKNSHRISVYNLPSYSPDYNPIEKLWKKIKENGIHLHYFPTFDDLKNKVEITLIDFQNLKQEILKLFVFYNELESKNPLVPRLQTFS